MNSFLAANLINLRVELAIQEFKYWIKKKLEYPSTYITSQMIAVAFCFTDLSSRKCLDLYLKIPPNKQENHCRPTCS